MKNRNNSAMEVNESNSNLETHNDKYEFIDEAVSVKTKQLRHDELIKKFDEKLDQSDSLSKQEDKITKYHCPYCNIYCSSKPALKVHCQTESHLSVILSDNGHDWKYRPPPRGVHNNDYSLCSSVSDVYICRFGNQCVQAHSKNEMDEWVERFSYRCMKLKKARERELHGATYADSLLEKLRMTTQNFENVLSETVDGVSCEISSNTNLCISQKPVKYTWVITLTSYYYLHNVALLHDAHRNHFYLKSIRINNCQSTIDKIYEFNKSQEWTNPAFSRQLPINNTGPREMEFVIEVCFTTEIFGTFRQAIAIDFGVEPVLQKKFCVDIVSLDDFKEIETVKTTVITTCERWCNENMNIIPFHPLYDTDNHDLLNIYSPPTNSSIHISQSSLEKFPSKGNYTTRMHDLLNYEEMAQFDLISHFNVECIMSATRTYLLDLNTASEAKYANNGELFSKLELSSELSEDSPQGKLILNYCSSALISLKDAKGRNCYQAIIETKTRNEIFFRLSKKMVDDLNISVDEELAFDIQFELNRIPLCEMHYALDQLSNTSLDHLFPDIVSEPTIPWNPSLQWKDTSDMKLNLKQREALIAISTDIKTKLPPILIIGPFGTGKTFTLAQAIKEVLQQPDTRILICTHSNSAADIYIKEYLHPDYQSGKLSTKPLRIYSKIRRPNTVRSVVQKYCLMNAERSEFILPTKIDLIDRRIIIATINNTITLVRLGIEKGFFTHILIDEAAQVMECATHIPLSLANESTRIVLAGDYMQLSSEVFSGLCRERNFHLSLLERLYDLYPAHYPCRIMLVENYRSHPLIIKYTSNFFYEGRLVAKGKVSPHPTYSALTFFAAQGEDVQDSCSTAYYNSSEIMEVVERVKDIVKTWPTKLWGPVREDSIGVVTPYLDQVIRIRAALAKERLFKISVERVFNVQGKEFRVVILTTVRTRNSCPSNNSGLDFGFLSNARLMTTAITRAQSLVAVVGDPISLCSVGKCSKLWEEFISLCAKNQSLYGITWKELKNQLDGIEYRKIYGLNPLAQEFVPRLMFVPYVQPPMNLNPHQNNFYPYQRQQMQYAAPYPGSVFPPAPYPPAGGFVPNNQPYGPLNHPSNASVPSSSFGMQPIVPPPHMFNSPMMSPYGFGYYQGMPMLVPPQNVYPPAFVPPTAGPSSSAYRGPTWPVPTATHMERPQSSSGANQVSTDNQSSDGQKNFKFRPTTHFPLRKNVQIPSSPTVTTAVAAAVAAAVAEAVAASTSSTTTTTSSGSSFEHLLLPLTVSERNHEQTSLSCDSGRSSGRTTSDSSQDLTDHHLVQEISRLLSDSSPTKLKKALAEKNQTHASQSSNDFGLSSLRRSINRSAAKQLPSALSNNLEKKSSTDFESLSSLRTLVNNWQAPQIIDSNAEFSESLIRHNRFSHVDSDDLGSQSTNSMNTNLPLYLRKGNQPEPQTTSSTLNLGTSRGWDSETITPRNSFFTRSKTTLGSLDCSSLRDALGEKM